MWYCVGIYLIWALEEDLSRFFRIESIIYDKDNFMDISRLMQQAQAMGEKVKEQQDELKKKIFTGSAGGDMVKTKVNGEGTLINIEIDPTVIDPEDSEMLSDLIVAAVNDAQKKVSQAKLNDLQGITGGMDLSSLGIDLDGIFK